MVNTLGDKVVQEVKQKCIGNNITVSDIEYKIVEPVIYYYSLKGKNIRKQIGYILGVLFQISQDEIEKANDMIDILHNTSLVIDDIQDGSDMRRGMSSAHIKYGISLSISGAYLTIFRLLHEYIHNDKNTHENKQEIIYSMIDNLYYAHLGQGMDVYYTKEKIIPTLEEYKEMMYYKTGLLFTSFLNMFQYKTKNVIIKKRLPEIKQALINFSYFFQIRDDYINITDVEYWKSKGICQDFDEEKISYIITFCNHYKVPYYETIIHMLSHSKTIENKMKLIELMYNSGVFDYIYKELQTLENHILSVIPGMKHIMTQLPYYPCDIKKIRNYIEGNISPQTPSLP